MCFESLSNDIWINLGTKNGFIETNNKAGSGRETLAWRLSPRNSMLWTLQLVAHWDDYLSHWIPCALGEFCRKHVTFRFTLLKRCVRYALLEWQMYPCRWASLERDFSWQRDCNRCFFFCKFNISLTIFLSTGCHFNKRTQQEFILSGNRKRMLLFLARCIKPLHKI